MTARELPRGQRPADHDLGILDARPCPLVQRWVMHSILWASLIGSAGVAVVTTLLVEYLAKPGLEARKDRILEDRREQRAALYDLKRVTHLLPRLAIYTDGASKGLISVENLMKLREEFSECTARPYDVIDPPNKLTDEWLDTMLIMHRFAVTKPDTALPAEVEEKFSLAFLRATFFDVYFSTAKWHLWRRRKLVKKIKSSHTLSYFKHEGSGKDNQGEG